MSDKFDLDRFIKAQEHSYERALADVKDGRKKGHWIWYIFPQIVGLGMSPTAVHYSIVSLDEAKAYMENHYQVKVNILLPFAVV